METTTQIKSLLNKLSEGLFEKQHILAIALLSAIAEESIFLLGPPGTAKSLVARRLKLAFKDGKSFEYLMSRFSTPDEIFGPVSISLLKNEDRYERVIDGFMPTADIVFLDEIWKACPSIQNALLTAINERIFQNGNTTINLPMKALIAASNELPAEDEGLEALWDRFLVRMVSNCIQSETEFFKMVRQNNVSEVVIPENLLISNETYQEWKSKIYNIAIPDDVCFAVSYIRKSLQNESKNEDSNAMDFYISDRRWKKCFHLMQTSAFLNGRKSVDMTDLVLMIHCLWNKVDTISIIIKIVLLSLTNNIDKWLEKTSEDIDKALKEKSQKHKKVSAQNPESQFSVTNYFYYTVINYPSGKCYFYKADYDYLHEVESKKTTKGIIYRDEEKKAWIIRALYDGTPFVYKNTTSGKVFKVNLNKCNGGVIIGGMPYGFERQTSLDAELEDGSNKKTVDIAVSTLKELDATVYPAIDALHDLFAKGKNIFLSETDYHLVKQYLNDCEDRIDQMRIKSQNTKQLL